MEEKGRIEKGIWRDFEGRVEEVLEEVFEGHVEEVFEDHVEEVLVLQRISGWFWQWDCLPSPNRLTWEQWKVGLKKGISEIGKTERITGLMFSRSEHFKFENISSNSRSVGRGGTIKGKIKAIIKGHISQVWGKIICS
jgi:hypothetical protein